jgi:CheY-specific phosphatase CheX
MTYHKNDHRDHLSSNARQPVIPCLPDLEELNFLFTTMTGHAVSDCRPGNAERTEIDSGAMLSSTIDITGEVSCRMQIDATAELSRAIALSFVGDEDTVESAPELIQDCLGELANVIAGSIESSLCEGGAKCGLGTPGTNHHNVFGDRKKEGDQVCIELDGLPGCLYLTLTGPQQPSSAGCD